uniref:hypothetical protein n=1 Tax=Streptomyces tubercidicus TaxID=47759 RepID=UPI0037DC3E66|nr:hypothetical protein OG690_38190 [Streptomyces tubercidicus]
MELQLINTNTTVNTTVQRLLATAADKLTRLGLTPAQPADAGTLRVAIGMTAHRIHGIGEFAALHHEAARVYRRWETVTDGRALQETRRPTRANADNTRRAFDRLSPLADAVVEASQMLDAAKQARDEDVAAAHAAVGDLTGLTNEQVIDRMYAAAGFACGSQKVAA